MKNISQDTAKDRFFAPLENAIVTATNSRACPVFTDSAFLYSGIGRCLENVESGRDWVQRFPILSALSRGVDNFFCALRSSRRLAWLREVNRGLLAQCAAASLADPFAEHCELDKFAIYAGDGHYHKCSSHEEPIAGKRRPVGHFFALNLRNRSLSHLDIARPDVLKEKKAEHDMSVLKRLRPGTMRMGESTGVKVIWVYDRAVIDFQQWFKWKQGSGIYILTREKEKMALMVMGEKSFDRNDPRNIGVAADQLVGHSHGRMIRRIIYTDPVSGQTFRFITNEMTIPPGLIAYLYKKRWDVEKVFDETRNKLHEGKSWGKSSTAKSQQAMFICMTYNLMTLFENTLQIEEGIVDTKALRRRAATVLQQTARAAAHGRQMNPLLLTAKHASQRSLQFIRWLRTELASPTLWREAMAALRPLMTNYLQ